MNARYSDKSTMSYYEAASVFAAAFARTNNADIYTFASRLSPKFMQVRGESTLRTVERLSSGEFWMHGGTDTVGALKGTFDPAKYDHVLILTDEVYNSGYGWYGYGRTGGTPSEAIPANIPLYTFNLAGYAAGQTESSPYRITVGGLSDAAFAMMAVVESSRGGAWPWEA